MMNTAFFGCFILTNPLFSVSLEALKHRRLTPRLGVFFMPRRISGGRKPKKSGRYSGIKHPARGNTGTASMRGVETRHLRGGFLRTLLKHRPMKNRKKGSLAPALTPAPAAQEIDWSCIFRMEDAICRVWTISDMLVGRLTKELDDDSENKVSGKVAAGLQLIESEAFNSLQDAFDQVTDYCRQLRNQTQGRN